MWTSGKYSENRFQARPKPNLKDVYVSQKNSVLNIEFDTSFCPYPVSAVIENFKLSS